MDNNCDMGEIPRLLKNNVYSDLMDHVTSISLACGGHAGDTEMMRELVKFWSLETGYGIRRIIEFDL